MIYYFYTKEKVFMKTKFKSVFTGLFYTLATAAFIGLAVYNYIITNKLQGYLAVLTFIVGTISLMIGTGMAYMDGLALLDKIFRKKEGETRGKQQ